MSAYGASRDEVRDQVPARTRGGARDAIRVAIEPVRARCPHEGVREAVAPLLAPLAPARKLRILEVAWSRGPGLELAPWTLAGVQSAAASAGLDTVREPLEFRRGLEGLGGGLDLVTADLPGTRRPRSVPARWFGDHACLVIPMASVDHGQPRARGPLEAAFAALDVFADGPRHREDPDVAARLLGTVFASLTVVLDGSWWAELSADATAARALTPLERCFAVGIPQPDPTRVQDVARSFDAWFAHRLHLQTHRARGSARLRTAGSGASLPWPRIPAAPSPIKRRAGKRVIEALWKPAPAKPGLGPTTPGSLARIWKDWSP